MFEQMKGRMKRSKVEGLSTMMEDILGHGRKTEFYVKYKGSHCRILKAREECDEIITDNFPFAAVWSGGGGTYRGGGRGPTVKVGKPVRG